MPELQECVVGDASEEKMKRRNCPGTPAKLSGTPPQSRFIEKAMARGVKTSLSFLWKACDVVTGIEFRLSGR